MSFRDEFKIADYTQAAERLAFHVATPNEYFTDEGVAIRSSANEMTQTMLALFKDKSMPEIVMTLTFVLAAMQYGSPENHSGFSTLDLVSLGVPLYEKVFAPETVEGLVN